MNEGWSDSCPVGGAERYRMIETPRTSILNTHNGNDAQARILPLKSAEMISSHASHMKGKEEDF